LWAAFYDSNSAVDENWSKLVQALSGLVGASFPFLNTENTISPSPSFFPSNPQPSCSVEATRHLRMGQLPRETACTENIAPWLLLTPCRGAAGVSSMLSPLRACSADFMSIGIHYSACEV